MGEGTHDDLRRLAAWLLRRREVDEVLEVLTRYGPTANERLAGHREALEVMLEAEREAYRRYADAAPRLPQRPLPVVLPDDTDQPSADVHSLLAARVVRRS